MKNLKVLLAIMFLFIIAFVMGVFFGADDTIQTVKSRALKSGTKECYTQSDIEYIVFGESQN